MRQVVGGRAVEVLTASANQSALGDLEGAMLREGNVHSAKDWKMLL